MWAWRPSWSCDLDHLYKLWFPLSNLALIGQAVSEENMFEIVDDQHGYTISSPCEPDGSGEFTYEPLAQVSLEVEIDHFFCLNGDIWNFFLQKCFLSSPLSFI